MSELPHLILNSQADRRIKKGHLWLYSNEVDTTKTPLKQFQAGDLVQVQSTAGAVLGLAFINPQALICGRMLTRDANMNIGRKYLKKRIQSALKLRELCFEQPFYRLVYGDSDLLPGVVIDRYGQYFVVQISVAGFEPLIPELVDLLEVLFEAKGVLVKNDHQARELEGMDEDVRVFGQLPDKLLLEENGCAFEIPSSSGQKTGWFYDHRVNRSFLQDLVPGKRVLDVFSYVGGWGIQAAVAGALQVTCVDASELACQQVLRNAQINEVDSLVEVIRGKAIDVLKRLNDAGESFDVVVLDPPAFIKRKKDQKSGEAAYRHLNELAIRLLGKEGILVSASCSRPLSNDSLVEIVRGAARHLDRNAQLIFTGCQGPDHPVHPAIPETNYIKAQFYRIFREV